jgi:D-aminopeptidase
VSAVSEAQIRSAIDANPEIGRSGPTLNPLVLECNDGYLNDLHAFAVTAEHYRSALSKARPEFERGAVGAGRGMSAFDLKGGIGSSSRIVHVSGERFTVGALVLANFGRLAMLSIAGVPIGRLLARRLGDGIPLPDAPERGSIIMLIATDAPLSDRQLGRMARRAAAGLARTGSVYGHGSGDIALAFSTGYTVAHDASRIALPALIADAALDPLFAAAAESVEQAIVDALWQAVPVAGRDTHVRRALRDVVADLETLLRACAPSL